MNEADTKTAPLSKAAINKFGAAKIATEIALEDTNNIFAHLLSANKDISLAQSKIIC